MLRVQVDKLKPGMTLARPVRKPSSPRVYYLNRGVALNWKTIRGLARLKVPAVWINFNDLDFLDDVVNEEALEAQAEVYVNIRKSFSTVGRMAEAELDGETFRENVASFFDALAVDTKNMQLLHHLEKFDNYLYGHCVNVCSLAMMLALKMSSTIIRERSFTNFRKSTISLGVGCLLHDIGKLRVPREILDKPGKLTPDEFAEMKRHTQYGFETLRERIDPSAAAIALHHHQRYDGSGYPDDGQRKGKAIHIFSRIATLADVYDAATSARCYSPAKPAVQVLGEMKKMAGWFDPELATEFFRMMPPFPIGSIVTLSDGNTAAVVDYDPDHPLRPDVRLLYDAAGKRFTKEREVPLKEAPEIVITKLDGKDVTDFTLPLGKRPEQAGSAPQRKVG